MTEYALRNEADRKICMVALMDAPADGSNQMVIRTTKDKRSLAQNNLMWQWITHIGKEQGDTPEGVHREVKLRYGVPILLRDNDDFARSWEPVRPHSYEDKLRLMRYINVTSIMGVKQMSEFLETMELDYGRNGIPLPKKDDEYWLALGYRRVA